MLLIGALSAGIAAAQPANLPKPQEPIPYAYMQECQNGKILFVMLPPADAKLDEQLKAYRDQTDRLKRAYPQSGAYRKNETTPLWTYEGPFAFDSFLANDGRHLVIIHGSSWFTTAYPMAAKLADEETQRQLDGPAISFFQDGRLLKTHTVRDIIGDPANLRNSISHLQWRAGEGMAEERGQFHLFTQDGQRCRFDLATGELVDKKVIDYSKQKIVFGIIFGITTIAVLFAIRWLVRSPGVKPISTPRPD